MSYKDDIPILVNYQGAHDSNFPSFALGTDYSHNYSDDKGVFFYIYDKNTKIAVGLKSFITSFSVNFQFEKNEIKTREGILEEVKSVGLTYKVGLQLPALSANDARVNAARLDTLSIFIEKSSTSGETAVGKEEKIYFLLGNLINNGKYTKKIDIKKADDIKTYAIQGFMKSFSYTVDTEMGFFEYDDKLWPKLYTFDLEIIAKPILPLEDGAATEKKLFANFKDDGTLEEELVPNGSFPFGVKI